MKETFFWTFSSDAISTLSDLTSEGFEVDWTVRSWIYCRCKENGYTSTNETDPMHNNRKGYDDTAVILCRSSY